MIPEARLPILALFLLASGCASLSSNSVDTSRQASLLASCHVPLKQQIDALALALLNEQRTPGLVVAVLTADRQRHIYSYGFTDRERRTPLSGDTLFAIGSVTKGFTAESVALVVADGQLRWDDTLGKLLPAERRRLSPDAQQITLLQLATHTAGLPRQMTTLHMFSKLTRYLFSGAPFYDDLDNGEFLDYLHDFVRPEQQAVVYSNLGYAILDYVISQHTGQTPQQIASQQIIAPLRLQHTGYQPEKLPGYLLRAHGHAGDQPKFVRRGQPVPDWRFSGYMVGAAALWSSASDLLTYLDAHLYGSADARLDRAFADATRVRFQQADHDSSALAWLSNHVSGQTIIYQSGFIGGYSSYIGMDVQHKNAIVVLQNSFNWDNVLGHRILVRLAEAETCPSSAAGQQ
ncbi:serine hydrolase domain-containing protein [Pantoea sp. B65]|uniref:serine hydrolase domain-containing protein n=1 Tax=Pantoea sp. B65 TaxID=2813359 RepID=UPI0039B3AC4C